MTVWLAIHLPYLALEAGACLDRDASTLDHKTGLVPSRPETAVVIMQQQQVLMCNRPAWEQGVRHGMKQGGVLALCAGVILRERQPAAEQRTLQALALSLLQFTPALSIVDDTTLLLDIGASLTLFGGIRTLYRRILQTTALHGLTVRYGMTGQPRAAWLLARHAGRRQRPYFWRCLNPARLAARLDTLPLTLLPAAQAQAEWLHGIGCRTLGALRALPRGGLRQRSHLPTSSTGSKAAGQRGAHRHEDILLQLDQAYGAALWPCLWFDIPPQFDQELTLPAPVDHCDAALFALRRLVSQMSGWLCRRQQALSGLTLWMTPEPLPSWQRSTDASSEQQQRQTMLSIGLSAPCWQESLLIRLIQEHLQHVTLKAPVTRLRLRADQTQSWQVDNDDLFPQAGGRPGDHAMLIGLLRARLGADALLQAAPQADHRPELASQWQLLPLYEQRIKSGRHAAPPAALPAATLTNRPFWLLPVPRRLKVRQDHPVLESGVRLQLLSAAERIESGWWDDALVQRDYFVAIDPAAHRYWIFRTRAEQRWLWFLHGLFA